jgi:hypothetical protein
MVYCFFVTTKVVKNAGGLEILRLCLVLCFILLPNHGIFVVKNYILLAKFIPSPLKGHHFVLVDMNHITKWIKVVPLKNMTWEEVCELNVYHIIGIQTLIMDQGRSFVSKHVQDFAKLYKVELLNHIHTMHKLMAKLSLVIGLWSNLSKRRLRIIWECGMKLSYN